MVTANFFMVVDGAQHQAMALLLAASIRHVHGADHRIIGYTPRQSAGSLDPAFFEAAEILGMEHAIMETEHVEWRERYPHGNKIIAFAQPRVGDVDVFLDTDTVLMAPMDLDLLAQPNTASAVPEGVPTWGRDDEDWNPVYAHFDLPVPTDRVNMVRGRGRSTLPYFNGGMVACSKLADSERSFGEIWLETALELDHNSAIENKRPWLDQVALPVAMARSGAKKTVLSDAYNYSMYRRKKPLNADIIMAHYHIPGVFRSHSELIDVLDVAESVWGPEAGCASWYRPFRKSRKEWAAERDKGQDS